ncbi:MAG: signal recognition particle protein [candidate division KSB1 bacterium]|nr:signal recognition particle protein [candidate division KSB1 bacterium]MDZ7295555.1 signal recognition particle protein [candidate division KSB1 bacterium]MDZ7386801.1 signal recognition particle protein [candidate division KSB1 bacterium]MDZ7392545.1 signal recognition particle protein [candidate division KSB1 bacterium]MDZ7414033.1 signal recognition particle protein [candidate division KSB1 bacterium]
MFQDIASKFDAVIRKLRGHGKLTEKNIAETMREVRRVLLEADVNYRVVKEFIDQVQQKALGTEVMRSVTPGQLVVKIIHDELTRLMGSTEEPLRLSRWPSVVMLVGLQGSGKTTFAGKLARHLRQRGRNPLLVAADVRRPAAITQLEVVGKAVDCRVFTAQGDAVTICTQAVQSARQNGFDVVIIDTGGRLHVDEELMEEVVAIKQATAPDEVLFVADGMTGQDAVNAATVFNERLDITGVVLTKMDGDARGGAAMSVRAVTGKPIKFLSVGEKLDALEKFHPERMASRILGMGDIVTLVERAQEAMDREQAERVEKRLRRQEFTLEDFYEQLQQLKKMGPLEELLRMLPGVGRSPLRNLTLDERAMVKTEAIINSMTPEERRRPHIINGSRRRRIARGSGTTVQDVNRLLHQFQMVQRMVKQMSKPGRSMGRPLGLP